MPRNIEIKAKVQDSSQLLRMAETLSKSAGVLIKQEDSFFIVQNGRLKLREFEDGSGELIFYNRPDAEGPKTSTYRKAAVSQPADLKGVLSDALGLKGIVKKTRRLFMVGQTRIHVDEVEGLGHFMELEVMLNDEQPPEEGEVIAKNLMKELGVDEKDLISGAYMDLLKR